MTIGGLQQLTLLDYPGKTACTVFLNGCNFRCPFCHNWGLVGAETGVQNYISEDSLFEFLKSRVGKLDGVVISGGEPTIHDGLDEFIGRIRELGYLIKLDTNGTNPEMLNDLLDCGLLDYVAMDIKTGNGGYARVAGVKHADLEAIKASIYILRNSGVDHEFRTTVVDELHKPIDFELIGRMIAGAEKYYIQAFVDSPEVPFKGLHAPSREKLRMCLEAAQKYVPGALVRGEVL